MNRTRLPVNALDDPPTFSPDGRKVANVVGGTGDEFDISVSNLDGTQHVPLTNDPAVGREKPWSH
ncbi:MAG: hypothetical protein JWN98_2008 [Abditibacteriota bacterium]|nr:hypothetical protein [Abditibacteriota bacterium]